MTTSRCWLRARSETGSATTTTGAPGSDETGVALTRSVELIPSRDPETVTGDVRARASSSGVSNGVRRSPFAEALSTRPFASTTWTDSVPVTGIGSGRRPVVTSSATWAAVASARRSRSCRLATDSAT